MMQNTWYSSTRANTSPDGNNDQTPNNRLCTNGLGATHTRKTVANIPAQALDKSFDAVADISVLHTRKPTASHMLRDVHVWIRRREESVSLHLLEDVVAEENHLLHSKQNEYHNASTGAQGGGYKWPHNYYTNL